MGLIYAILGVLEAAVDRFIALPVLLSRYDLSPKDLEVLCCSPANPSSNSTQRNLVFTFYPLTIRLTRLLEYPYDEEALVWA